MPDFDYRCSLIASRRRPTATWCDVGGPQIAVCTYALLICAGSDGSNAARQVERIATGWRLRKICQPVIVCTHAQTLEAILAPKVIASEDLQRCEEVGTTLASGLAGGIY